MGILDEMENVARSTMMGIELVRLLDEYPVFEDPESCELLYKYSSVPKCTSLLAQIEYMASLELLGNLELARQIEVSRRLEQWTLLEKYKQAEIAEKLMRLRANISFIDNMDEIPAKVFLELYPYFDEVMGLYCFTNVCTGRVFIGKHVKALQRAAEHLSGAFSYDNRVFMAHKLDDCIKVRIVPLCKSNLGSLDALEASWLQGLNAEQII